MVSSVRTFGVFGASGYPVTAECFLSSGLPAFEVVGLPDTAVRESRDRVRAAFKSMGKEFSKGHITVNLAPAGTKKEGPLYDLPIMLSILSAMGIIKPPADDCAFIGELSLSGELRPVRGVLSMALAAKEAGIKKLFVPVKNAKEASVAGEELEVYGAKNASEVVLHMTGALSLSREPVWHPKKETKNLPDFSEVRGQNAAKRALEIAAAGGHNVLMVGPPGSGKSMLAERIASILPEMTREEALETTELHSLAGLISAENPLMTSRPFRSPHHTTSAVALSGGGTVPHPGEISLSHNGVLFLDELPEFSRDSLEILRQPIENGNVTISRVAGSTTYPARFMLVCAMNPCKCGWHGYEDIHTCTCSLKSIESYNAKISGPLLDRIDIQINVPGVTYEDMSSESKEEPSSAVRLRVERARERARARGKVSNAALSAKELHEIAKLGEDSKALLSDAFTALGLTGRSYDKILRVALTIADLAESDTILPEHIAEAIQYRSLDRKEE